MIRPEDLFDREHEWQSLHDFVASGNAGSTLGLVHGRRRQGKTYLLESLAEVTSGLYFAALKQSSAQNLDRLAETYRSHTHSRVRVSFRSWEEALAALLALGENASEPVVVVIDEFPYLLDGAPELSSALQSLLSPRGEPARSWRTRLILCGSALSTMRGLLAGSAPLRGRAALDLMVHPFDYREAAEFWHVAHDPGLAVRLHALLGGTPAYRDMVGGHGPGGDELFDDWVAATLLNPASAMFREGNVLLSEEGRIADTTTYLSVLSAISQGATRRGEIAAALGRPQSALAHPLAVLTEARLIAPLADAFKQKRTTFHVAEPIVRLNQLIVRPNETRLSRHRGTDIWAASAGTVAAQIYGPHFEELARVWCAEYAQPITLGGSGDVVAPTELACAEHGHNHQVDVVVVDKHAAGAGGRVTAIGEAKWRMERCRVGQLRRLEHLRALLNAQQARLLLFSRSGFTDELTAEAAARPDTELVSVERLYRGG